MMNKIMKGLVDLLYGTQRVRRRFLTENPDETVLAADASKGICTKENEDIKRGMSWVGAQRAVLLLSNKRIVCGQWNIALENIQSAQLLKINSIMGSGQVLKIHCTDGTHYQFGMQQNAQWTNQNVLPLTSEKGKVKYSLFSFILRLVLVGCILYLLYHRYFLQ